MEDDQFGFGEDAYDDIDPDHFFENELAAEDALDGRDRDDLLAGDGDDDFAFPDGGAGGGNGLNTAADADGADAAPPVIQNVQQYLPNVAPNAFPVVVAVLAQADLGVGVDLRELSCATRNVEFMPNSRIASATMRLHEPSAVVLVRNSGSLTIIGAASVSEARQAAELAARIIRKALSLDFEAFRFRVRSIMARFNACSPVRLDELAHHHLNEEESPGVGGVFGSYEPERFNGCTVRLVGKSAHNRWNVSCTVFVTGKINLLGARSLDELRFAFDALVPILAKYIGGRAAPVAAPVEAE